MKFFSFYDLKGEFPVKWLAIESLFDWDFNTKTDVWSYGIVLWELFSLGKLPYPGINSDYKLMYDILKDGYRMPKPDYVTGDMYIFSNYIMLSK